MVATPVHLDPVVLERQFGVSKRQSEKVIYYRKPTIYTDSRGRTLPHKEPGWIVWNDSQREKRIDLLMRGFVPLTHLPRVWDEDPSFRQYGPWGPILTHPQGPAEFPADQIIALGWYRPENCPVPGVKWPQLATWCRENGPIKEYDCPECTSRRFLTAYHLARHLKNSHEYDRTSIIALGQALGIDFTKEVARRGVVEHSFNAEQFESPPAAEVPAVTTGGHFEVQTVKVQLAPVTESESGVAVVTKGKAKTRAQVAAAVPPDPAEDEGSG